MEKQLGSKNMKILLVSPNFGSDAGRPLLGLAYIASVIESKHIVHILDLALYSENLDKLDSFLDEFNPEVVGITCYTLTYPTSMSIANHVKKRGKNIITIMGGVHPTIRPDDCINEDVDFVVRGEGEETFPEILDYLEGIGELSNIKGISYKRDGNNTHNSPRPTLTDLNKYPFPARHLLELDKYSQPIITIMTSRGCPFNCIYCCRAVMGKKYTAQTPERVIEEIKEAMKTSKHTHILFVDDLFTFDKKRVEEICKLIILNNINITWSCSSRVTSVDKELLELMKKAGCTRIGFGVESGDDKILKSLRKGVTVEQTRKTFRDCKEVGIETAAFFMIGAPEDTRETVLKTIDFAIELDPINVSWSIVTPFPGTGLWEQMGMDESVINGWNDFGHLNENNTTSFDIKNLKKEEISELYLKADLTWRRHIFYRNISKNPTYLIKKVVTSPIISMKQFIGLIKT